MPFLNCKNQEMDEFDPLFTIDKEIEIDKYTQDNLIEQETNNFNCDSYLGKIKYKITNKVLILLICFLNIFLPPIKPSRTEKVIYAKK